MRFAVMSLLSCGIFCGSLLAANISGTWLFQVETSAGSGTPTFTFKQDGQKLTGHYSGALGEADLTGTVDGENITWSFPVSGQGVDGTATYKGKLDGANKMKGTLDLAGAAEGTFEATKK